MRYLIFSDVHSNLEALKAFKKVIRKIPHDKKVCLGDLVGYYTDPNPCLNWLRKSVDILLAGNHDFAVLNKTDITHFNPQAYLACMWTRQRLTERNREFLDSLPAEMVKDGVHWAHSSPYEPEEWHYIWSVADGEENFDHFDTSLCFVGHTHRPLVIEQDSAKETTMYVTPELQLEPDCRYIINVGSLGQPRDGNPDPSFVLYDSKTKMVEFHRFTYDLASTQEKVLLHGLPQPLADRLGQGT